MLRRLLLYKSNSRELLARVFADVVPFLSTFFFLFLPVRRAPSLDTNNVSLILFLWADFTASLLPFALYPRAE